MTVKTVSPNAPTYIISTSDISGSKVAGVAYIGAKIFNEDTGRWYILGSDLKLKEYYIASGSSGLPLY